MITALAIKNYALIEDLRVEMNEGLTVITGETGAGKSIILGALSLLLGKRADIGSVKDASKKCVVEGYFSIETYGLQLVFEENDLDYDPHTIIRREILPNGKSRAFVNDTPVALSQLQAIAPLLVDIHSQIETLEIVSENFQMEVIDALAGNSKILKTYQAQLAAFQKSEEKLEVLKSQKASDAKELEYNTFLYNELKQAELQGMNQEELEETYETLNNAEEIQSVFSQVEQLLNEEQIGTVETAKEARIAIGRIKGFSGIYEDYWNRLNSTIIELEDLSEEMRNTAEKVASDPQRLSEVNEKLQQLYKLQQKHGMATVDELLTLQNSLENKVNTTLGLDDKIAELELEGKRFAEEAHASASQIRKEREKAIPSLKKQLEEVLALLGLPNAQFQFNLTASQNFRKNGTDTLELLFTANKGTSMGPLKKVASGGEMSRIMLAIKSVLAKYKKLPTIIFDEIDSGVSGEIANKMVAIMLEMGRNMQVLAITHLPQVAARGEHHLKVYKEDMDHVTVTHLKRLEREERLSEIAQMLGGKNISEAALANAKELLN